MGVWEVDPVDLACLRETNPLGAGGGTPGPQGPPGPAGPAGATGASAYATWLAAGNTGTEQDFLDSLQGEDGSSVTIVGSVENAAGLPLTGDVNDGWITEDNGHLWVWDAGSSAFVDVGPVRGPEGPEGPQGPTGSQGVQGPRGSQGVPGDDGVAGAAGPPGNIGPQGSQGSPGAPGVQGVPGPAGADGAQGSQGSQGVPGTQGIQGVPGPEGPQGTSVTLLGSVLTTSDLPVTGNDPGDGYIVEADGNLWVWDGATWTDVGQIVGPAGSTGASGPQGVPGDTGPQGIQGIQGVPGAEGADGPPGPTAVSTDAGNTAVLGTDSLIYVQHEVLVQTAAPTPVAGLDFWIDPDAVDAETAAPKWVAWTGTQAAYDAITPKDPSTLYVVV